MSNDKVKIDRESLQLARMKGDSQDGFSCVGFVEDAIPAQVAYLPTPNVVDHSVGSISTSAMTTPTRQRPGSVLDLSLVRQQQQYMYASDQSCVSRSADDSEHFSIDDSLNNHKHSDIKSTDGQNHMMDMKQDAAITTASSATSTSKRRREDEPATLLVTNSPSKKYPAKMNSIAQYQRKQTDISHVVNSPNSNNHNLTSTTTTTPSSTKNLNNTNNNNNSNIITTPSLNNTMSNANNNNTNNNTTNNNTNNQNTNNATIDLSSLPAQYKPLFINEFSKFKTALLEAQKKKEVELELQIQNIVSHSNTLKEEISALKRGNDSRAEQSVQSLIETLRKLAIKERREMELKLHENRKTYGYLVVLRDTHGIDIANENGQVWHDGELIRASQARLKTQNEEKVILEIERKKMLKLKTNKGKSSTNVSSVPSLDDELLGLLADTGQQLQDQQNAQSVDGEQQLTTLELNEMDEIQKLRLFNVKRDIGIVQTQQEDYDRQKIKLMREEQLFLDEAVSKFSGYPLIDNRYVFLNLLGKGGFSEVYKAFDLVLFKYVACKLHQLNTLWSEDRTKNYLKHVIRESRIQKSQQHKRIVRMLDVFKIDSNTLVTVQDQCDGGDLDMYLKMHKQQGEKEARVILWQIFAGLKKLNEGQHRVIHYDQKPANILFHQGEVKITDFGLAKELDGNSTNIELTSQGAGTLAYQPPECFVTSYTPTISSAVDVWSCGIIFYQMLFGQRPFDFPQHSAESLHKQKKVDIDFPLKPPVSDGAKDFIMRCLSLNPTDRPDICQIFNDVYFKFTKEK